MESANASKLLASGSFDDHTQRHVRMTLAQLTFFISCSLAAALWVMRFAISCRRSSAETPTRLDQDAEAGTLTLTLQPLDHAVAKEIASTTENGPLSGNREGNSAPKLDGTTRSKPSANVPLTPTVDAALRDVMVFGLIMFYFFLCDYVKIFHKEERIYNRDQFLFLLFILFLVACAFTIKPTQDKILNRDQTEEWKGWMQVMFVWYHFFAAKEWYNWIRIYIACYVWMTGFGNFSFFWVKGDYSLWRVLKMLFRMNFLVLVLLVVTDNEYMLYYICAMHTYWFLTVYLFMRILSSWNTHRYKMAAKFAVYVVCNGLIFEIPGVCSRLFRPLWFVFQYHDNRHDIMHEWEFRAGLDHWACLLGMLCAYNYPHYEAFVKYLERSSESDKASTISKLGIKIAMLLAALVAGSAWYLSFMRKDKIPYNATHCYSSLLAILVFIVARNLFGVLRRHYVGLFASLGKVTLETYLSQLHVYLQSNAKHLIGYIHGYPLLNFALATIIYLVISHLLFHLTLSFSAFFIQKDWRKGARMAAVGGGVVGVSWLIALSLTMKRSLL